MPLLITVTKEANIPRLENIKYLMKYKKADIKEDAKIKIPVYGLNEMGIEESIVGLNGSPTKVKNIESVVITKKDIKNYSPDEKGIAELFKDLVTNHLVE